MKNLSMATVEEKRVQMTFFRVSPPVPTQRSVTRVLLMLAWVGELWGAWGVPGIYTGARRPGRRAGSAEGWWR